MNIQSPTDKPKSEKKRGKRTDLRRSLKSSKKKHKKGQKMTEIKSERLRREVEARAVSLMLLLFAFLGLLHLRVEAGGEFGLGCNRDHWTQVR